MADLGEAVLGLLLVFFLPGFGLVRALFPERRVFRPLSLSTLLEQLTASVILSIGIAILVGFAWLGSSVGVQANWSDPLVEATLGGVTLISFGVAVGRGGFARVPPPSFPAEPQGGHSDPMAIARRLDELAREERTLRHRLRVAGSADGREGPLAQELRRVQEEAARLRSERQGEYEH